MTIKAWTDYPIIEWETSPIKKPLSAKYILLDTITTNMPTLRLPELQPQLNWDIATESRSPW